MANTLEIYLNSFKQRLLEPNFYEIGLKFYEKYFYYMVTNKSTIYLRIGLPVNKVLDALNKKIFDEIFQGFNYVKEHYEGMFLDENGMLDTKVSVEVIELESLYTICDNSNIVLVGALNMVNFSHELISKIMDLPFENLDVSANSNRYSLEEPARFGIHDHKTYLESNGLSNDDITQIKELFLNHFTGKTSPNMNIFDNDGLKEEIGW